MEKDLQAEKMPGKIRLSEHGGRVSLEIDGVPVPNVCGYRLSVNSKDPLIVNLVVEMEFFRSDMQEEISFASQKC